MVQHILQSGSGLFSVLDSALTPFLSVIYEFGVRWPSRWEELIGGAVLRWVPKTQRFSTHILAFDMDGTLIKTKSGQIKTSARCLGFNIVFV